VQVSQPFDKKMAQGLASGRGLRKSRVRIDSRRAVRGAARGNDGVYVIALKNKLPSENPPFETIRDQVTRDYQFSQAVQQARKTGEEFTAP